MEEGITKYGKKAYSSDQIFAITNEHEFFAVWFAKYYASSESERKYMKTAYPETWQFFESLDQNARKGSPTRHLRGYQFLGRMIEFIKLRV